MTRRQSRNLRGNPESKKQVQRDGVRIYWAPILTRGKLHLEVLGEDFPGETVEGAAALVAKVRTGLNIRFQGSTPPDILFTDRGQGFYVPRWGGITPEYKAALAEHGLRAYYPDNAGEQPGKLSEVLLHETAVAWVRNREAKTKPREPWKETRAEYTTRLRGICQYINGHYNVEDLCRSFPRRLQQLVDKQGDRINR